LIFQVRWNFCTEDSIEILENSKCIAPEGLVPFVLDVTFQGGGLIAIQVKRFLVIVTQDAVGYQTWLKTSEVVQVENKFVFLRKSDGRPVPENHSALTVKFYQLFHSGRVIVTAAVEKDRIILHKERFFQPQPVPG
jgi:hypothetical protein